MHHLIICLSTPKSRITILLYIIPFVFLKVVFYLKLFRGTTNLTARLICCCFNGYFVFSENTFCFVCCWVWVLIYSPNASLQLEINGKYSFLDTEQQRLHSIDVLYSYRRSAHFDGRKQISPLNMYNSLYTNPTHLNLHSALETYLREMIAEPD